MCSRWTTCLYLCLFALPPFSTAQGPYPDGKFTFPPNLKNDKDQSSFPQYRLGSELTITFESKYTSNNLYYAQYGDDAHSQLISGNLRENQTKWVVTPSPWNLSLPFHMHVVNQDGSDQDKLGGGFWSSGFFIYDPNASKTSSTSSAATSTSKSTSSASSASSATSTVSTTPTAVGATATPSAPPRPTATASSSAISGGAIAGIVIGIIAVFAIFGGLLYWLGLRRRAKNAAVGPAPLQYSDYPAPGYGQPLVMVDRKPTYAHNFVHEAPDQPHSPVELPSGHAK